MKHSTPKPNKADLVRFDKLMQLGCIVSHVYFHRYEPAQVHHLLSGNKRRGHQFTIPLSPWFHQGIPPNGMSAMDASLKWGPSLAKTPRRFRESFGTDQELLDKTNALIGKL